MADKTKGAGNTELGAENIEVDAGAEKSKPVAPALPHGFEADKYEMRQVGRGKRAKWCVWDKQMKSPVLQTGVLKAETDK